MEKIVFTNPHFIAAQNLIVQAEDVRYSISARIRYLNQAEWRLEKALEEAGGSSALEFIKIIINKEHERIRRLRDELSKQRPK